MPGCHPLGPAPAPCWERGVFLGGRWWWGDEGYKCTSGIANGTKTQPCAMGLSLWQGGFGAAGLWDYVPCRVLLWPGFGGERR